MTRVPTVAEDVGGGDARPCRAYRIGDHTAWIRRRMLRSMLLAALLAATASVLPVLVGAMAWREPAMGEVLGWAGTLTFAAVFIGGHWLLFGPRRWSAVEPLIWSGRHAAAALAAETGISDPTDREAARGWLDATPHVGGEPPARTYWRAYCHLLVGDVPAARSFAELLPATGDMRVPRATLMAQIALGSGEPFDVSSLRAAVIEAPDSLDRAIAASEVAALTAQAAWTCEADDVAPVLAMRPYIGRRARGTLLRLYWLPLVLVMAAVSVVWQLL